MFDVARAVTIEDLRQAARRRLPEFAFIPMDTGSGDGTVPARNVEAFRRRRFQPRVLVDVNAIDQRVEVFGRTYAQPFGLSAIGYAGGLRRDADLLLAEAAREADIPFMLSGGSNASIEQVSRLAPDHVWQQLYAAREPKVTEHFVGRARDCGVQVLVYTADSPLPPRNDWLVRSGIRLPAQVRRDRWPYVLWQAMTHPAWALGYFHRGQPPRMDSWAPYAPDGASATTILRTFQSQVPNVQTWRQLEWVRSLWPGKLVIKGVTRPEDARTALDLGVDAVAVSNHGGNKLDVMPSILDCLPSIVDVAASRSPVFFDGGIRRGSDLAVALSLGAQFCFIGRASLYGVIAGGRGGADRAIQILTEELKHTLIHIGAPDLQHLGSDFLVSERT